MDSSRLSRYQVELIKTIGAGNPDGEGPIDFDQLLEALSWKPTKASAQFSIRALIKRKLITKLPEHVLRRGRCRVCFELTEDGKLTLDPRGPLPEDACEFIDSGVSEPLLSAEFA